jgi:uncharacterized protein Yka (UPF0111/DUF47 family)
MYRKSGPKLDARSTILQKQLIDDNFTRYQSAISKIFLDAKAEFNIEKEIEKIENTVDKAVIKTAAVLFDQGEKYSFNVVKDISEIITKLNDEHSSV